jgi:hypothetical protein
MARTQQIASWPLYNSRRGSRLFLMDHTVVLVVMTNHKSVGSFGTSSAKIAVSSKLPRDATRSTRRRRSASPSRFLYWSARSVTRSYAVGPTIGVVTHFRRRRDAIEGLYDASFNPRDVDPRSIELDSESIVTVDSFVDFLAGLSPDHWIAVGMRPIDLRTGARRSHASGLQHRTSKLWFRLSSPLYLRRRRFARREGGDDFVDRRTG